MNILPLHEGHAIEKVAFGIEWSTPLPPSSIAGFEGVYDSLLKDQLPSKKPLVHFDVTISEKGGSAQHSMNKTGWVFERFAPNGEPERSLVLAASSLSATFHGYTRWVEVYRNAVDMMNPFLKLISDHSEGVAAFGLQYHDVFRVVGDKKLFTADMVLRRGSAILPASVFDRTSLWHAHHGYFTDFEEGPQQRKLTVVKVDLVDQNEDRNLRVTTVHKTIFTEPIKDLAQLDSAVDDSYLNVALHDMHDENKEVLRSVLNDEALKKIGLYGDGEG